MDTDRDDEDSDENWEEKRLQNRRQKRLKFKKQGRGLHPLSEIPSRPKRKHSKNERVRIDPNLWDDGGDFDEFSMEYDEFEDF